MVDKQSVKTEIGVLPKEWEIDELGNRASIIRGGSPRPIESFLTESPNGINWIKIGDVKTGDKYIYKTEERIKESGVARSREVNEGDFILSNSMSFGRPYILKTSGCIHDGWLAIREFKSTFDLQYLYYALCAYSTHKQYETLAAGSGVKNLNKKVVSSVQIPIPKREEQEKIAVVLSEVDELIANLEKLIAKKTAIKQGVMQELMSGERRLSGFSSNWEEIRLGDYSEIGRGGSPRPIQNYLTNGKGLNWIKIGDAAVGARYIFQTKEKIVPEGLSKTRFVKSGDLILSNSMSYGRPYILKIDGCIHDGWLAIQNYQNTFDTLFLFYVLGTHYVYNQYQQMADGSGVKNLNKDKVENLVLRVPSDISEQEAIAAVLDDFDSELEALKKRSSKYKGLKIGMMNELLTGRIRLV